MNTAEESLRRLHESIKAMNRSAKKSREIIAIVARAQGITTEEAERRIEAMGRRLFPSAR